ncbi:hypothetical protein ACLMJK_004411 [Lecanora helva]
MQCCKYQYITQENLIADVCAFDASEKALQTSEVAFTRSRRQDDPGAMSQKRSLLAELFPEETLDVEVNGDRKDQEVPRLPLPEVDVFDEDLEDEFGSSNGRANGITKAAATNAFKQKQLAVLIMQMASKSLVESDFRRIAPKGKHIEDWTGPGDILKVIPVRDPQTLEHSGQYFILFPNPAYARTYQSHVIRLQRVARTQTPTSIESPLPLQPGVIVEGEDVHALLQDYALCPPSQRLQLRMLKPPYAPRTRLIFRQRGYPQLVEGEAKAGRSVLFWIDGHQVTTSMIKRTLDEDGQERGLAWNMLIQRVDPSMAGADLEEDTGSGGYEGSDQLRHHRSPPARWILTFTDESRARGFIRAWHRKPFPIERAQVLSLVHTEFLW